MSDFYQTLKHAADQPAGCVKQSDDISKQADPQWKVTKRIHGEQRTSPVYHSNGKHYLALPRRGEVIFHKAMICSWAALRTCLPLGANEREKNISAERSLGQDSQIWQKSKSDNKRNGSIWDLIHGGLSLLAHRLPRPG